MSTPVSTHSILGSMHAQELLLLSLIRTLEPNTRRRVADEFQTHVELAESSHLNTKETHEHESLNAFRAHIKKLSILLASLS